jgi:cyclic pyranopterin phosphate synthase
VVAVGLMGPSTSRGPSTAYWLGEKLYLNITNRCSNDCIFCLRRFREGVGGFNLKLKSEPSAKEVTSELQEVINKKNWAEIVFCGFGEPLERLDCILQVTKWIRNCYGKPVLIRIDTNGHGCLLNRGREVIKELKNAGVNRISVSLNAHNQETYDQVCRPKLENAFKVTLDFIEKAKQDLEVEVTAVTIPEADLLQIEKIAQKAGVKFRPRQYLPTTL